MAAMDVAIGSKGDVETELCRGAGSAAQPTMLTGHPYRTSHLPVINCTGM